MIKCYDIATMLTDEFTEKNRLTYKEDAEKKRDFEVTCGFADQFNKKFECTEMTVDVTDSGNLIISFVSMYIEGYFDLGRKHDEFHELMTRAKQMSIKAKDEENFIISYVFDGIWQ